MSVYLTLPGATLYLDFQTEYQVLFVFTSRVVPSTLPRTEVDLEFKLVVPLDATRLFFVVLLVELLLQATPWSQFVELGTRGDIRSGFIHFRGRRTSPTFTTTAPLFLEVLGSTTRTLALFKRTNERRDLATWTVLRGRTLERFATDETGEGLGGFLLAVGRVRGRFVANSPGQTSLTAIQWVRHVFNFPFLER